MSVVAFVWTHLPATEGVTVGAAWFSATGAENCSEMLVLAATFSVPATGVVDFKKNEAWRVSPEPLEPASEPFALDALEDPDWSGVEPPVTSSTTTTIAMAAARADEEHPRAQAQRPAGPGLENVHGLRSLKTSPHSQSNWSKQRMGRVVTTMRQG